MPAPNTGGVLRSRIQDMRVGDYIVWKSNGSAYIMDGSVEGYTERPVSGATDTAIPYAMTYWYGVKVDKGLIIADRVIHHTISWSQLNAWELIEGKPLTLLDGTLGVFRSLGGGNAFANADETRTTTDQAQGAWPTNNEWDVYIAKKDYGTGSGRDDVWNYGTGTWCNETPSSGITSLFGNPSNSQRIFRGGYDGGNVKRIDTMGYVQASGATASRGFRPVFEYKEVIA